MKKRQSHRLLQIVPKARLWSEEQDSTMTVCSNFSGVLLADGGCSASRGLSGGQHPETKNSASLTTATGRRSPCMLHRQTTPETTQSRHCTTSVIDGDTC
jgi:hypothetical protein